MPLSNPTAPRPPSAPSRRDRRRALARRHAPDTLKLLSFSPQAAPPARVIPVKPWRPQGGPELRPEVVLEPSVEQVVLPHAIDAKILAGKAFALEPGLLQEPDRRDIGRDACRLDPMQLQRRECEWNDGVDRSRHVTLARIRRAHPVAEAARLGTTATNVGQRQAAYENIVVLAENEERISQVAALVLGIALDAATKGGSGQVVSGPSRLPRREEVATSLAQRGPFGTIGHLRGTQNDAVARDRGHQVGRADCAKECHG